MRNVLDNDSREN